MLPPEPNSRVNDDDEADAFESRIANATEASPSSHIAEPSPTINWIYFLLGAAILLPWNAMITAMPFFINRMGDSPFKSTFSSYLSASYQLSNFGAQFHATYTSNHSSKDRRIKVSLMLLLLAMTALLISTFIPSPPIAYFIFTISDAVLQSITGAYLLTSVVALASYFGPSAMQSIMSGQSAVGVVISLVQLATTAATLDKRNGTTPSPRIKRIENSDVDSSASLFFFVTTMGLVLAWFAYRHLTRLSAFRNVVLPFEAGKVAITEEEEALMSTSVGSLREIEPVLPVDVLTVAKNNWIYNLAVSLVFLVTLSIFPSITGAIQSVNPPSSSVFAVPTMFSAMHFVVFNTSDWIGRWICSFPRFQIWSRRRLLAFSILRLLFIPIFLACNINGRVPPPSGSTLAAAESSLINSDIIFFIVLFAFGVTNGWIASLVMMAAPSLAHNTRLRKEEVDVAAVLASFSIAGGLVLGSIANFPIRARICHCNPFLN